MASQLPGDSTQSIRSLQRNRTMEGVALIGIGLLALAGYFLPADLSGLLFLPALGLIFLLWGLGARAIGLLIPGGILSGLGLGIFLLAQPLRHLSEEMKGGVFLLAFALGWGVITLLSTLISDRLHWWPLIPGGILTLIGGAVLIGGSALTGLAALGSLLGTIGSAWPVGLIVLGLYLILWRRGLRPKG